MAVPVRQQAIYWGAAAAVAALVLWVLGDVILPFVLGGAVAYFLDPVADRLERLGLSRPLAVLVISVVAILLFVAVVIPAVLTIDEQLRTLFAVGPAWIEAAIDPEGPFVRQFPWLDAYRDRIEGTLAGAVEGLRDRGGAIASGLLTAGRGLLGMVLLLVIVPVVAVYLLLDWDRMVARIDTLLPREHAPTIRALAHQIDVTLSSFIRGQGTVMLILGAYYAAALALTGLNFGVVVGAVAGLLTFIPYVGAIVGGGLAIGLALFQFWGDWVMVAIVAAIFVSGQTIEGNVLTPKLVGGSVGLHPVWLIFALSAFGALFGFVGLLVAVPVAAALGVVARFAADRYTASPLYLGAQAAARHRPPTAPAAVPPAEPDPLAAPEPGGPDGRAAGR